MCCTALRASYYINAVSAAGLRVCKLNEYDYDVGLSQVYDHKGLPLSFLLLAERGPEAS